MANFSQPPFGLPFAFPPQAPQQPGQGTQSEQHDGRSDAYQAPAAEVFPNPWNIPGLNFQSYAQNTQQAQYTPSAWPLPPAPVADAWDPSLMPFPGFPFFPQNGAIPPPPFPNLNFAPSAPPAQSPLPSQQPSHPVAPPPALPTHQHPMPATNHRVVEMMDSDREDGEVSEGDRFSHSPAGPTRANMEPPRSFPQENSRAQNKDMVSEEEPYNPDRPAAGQPFKSAPIPPKQQTTAPEGHEKIHQRREEAKHFVRLLHTHNIGYHNLAKEEGLDSGQLRELYRSLNLPSEPEPVPPLRPNGTAALSSISRGATNGGLVQPETAGQDTETKAITSLKTNVAPVPPVKSAPSPIDRKEYIARLQAAKMGKQPVTANITLPQTTPPATSAVRPPAKTPQDEEKAARQTEMVKQRLAMLRNAQSSPASSPAPKPLNGGTAATTAAPSFPPAPASQSSLAAEDGQKALPIQFSSFSDIPGLFMNTSSTAPHAPTPSTPMQNARESNSRKRIGATAFAETTTPGNLDDRQVRPRTNPAQVYDSAAQTTDSSEHESGGSEMDLSEDHGSKPSAVSPPSLSGNGQDAVRTLPPIPDFPSRPASVIPASSAISTPGPQTPGSLARNQDLEKREKELAALKIKLKAKLLEKKQKAIAAAASSPQPQKQNGQVAHQVELPPKPPTTMATLEQPQEMSPASLVGTASAPAFSDMSGELRKRRRAEIESGLPSLEADIASNATRMAQLTKELEQLAANDEKMKQDKERLIRELEGLGVDTEGMPHAELQAKRDEIEREQEVQANASARTSSAPAPSSDHIGNDVGDALEPEMSLAESRDAPISARGETQDQLHLPDATSPAQQSLNIPGLGASITSVSSPLPTNSQQPSSGEVPRLEEAAKLDHSSVASPEAFVPEMPYSPASANVSAAPTANGVHGTVTPQDDEGDFYSPEPADQVPGSTVAPQLDAKSPSEEGEVAMSESDEEEEYEPDEPETLAEPTMTNIEERGADVETSSASSLTPSVVSTEEDGEIYEPPDVDQLMPDIQPTQAYEDSTSGTPKGEAEDGAMDISMSTSADESDSSGSTPPSGPEKIGNRSTIPHDAPEPFIPVSDDLAPELQAEAPPVVDNTAQELISMTDHEAAPLWYVPYESPLRMFKSYRYHPNFAQEVPGGFLSTTYSHQIDPDQPLCPSEAVGAPCNDPHCPYQHFRGINISGEKLLVQLGTANPGKTPEEKQLWNDGLRNVLKELRQKNTKDPHGIAMEIAKYRREFLKDDTRVVNL